ncbi:MAG: hypothetical protein L6427_11700 [Actinomycetia bacterium]|nr:hypothetical protein [Actinomycetes bacterium]
MDSIDPIILGHNQFIGVSHLSQDAARTRTERFSDMRKVGKVVEASLDAGVRGMMLSTHPKARDILDYLKAEGLSDEMNFYPLIPFAQGYVRKLNAVGMKGLVKDVFASASMSQKLSISLHGGLGLLRRDFTKLLGPFIDIELLTFQGVNVKAVFLHDAFVDLALALGAGEQIKFFVDHVRKNYDMAPAFETMNFPRLLDSFGQWGIERPLVMTTFNKIGFQMNPSREACEKSLGNDDVDVVAMSTLAAGYLRPADAYEYVFSLPNIESVVVGVSTADHALETFEIIKQHQQGVLSSSTPDPDPGQQA